MRLWPLDAMVFENGAGLVIRRGEKIEMINLAENITATEQRMRLGQVFTRLKQQIPDLKLAADQAFRLYDFAIDYAEEPPRLDDCQVKTILDFLKAQSNLTAKLSSIHINYWCGTHTKVTACQYLIDQELRPQGIGKENTLFSGDSPNDEPLFEFFPHSVGVANVRKFLNLMKTPPRYVTSNEGGLGFVELSKWLLSS